MKKTTSTILASIITLSLCTAPALASYTDCTDTAVTSLSDLRILSGYEDGSFKPENCLTRAEFAKMISTANGGISDEDVPTEIEFSDVGTDHWAKNYILHCDVLKAINGYEDGTFKPNDYVSYAEAVKICLCIAGYNNLVEKTGSVWYEPWLEAALEYKLIDKKDSDPDKKISRLEAAGLIYSTLDLPLCQVTGFSFAGGNAKPSFQIADGKKDENGKEKPFVTLRTMYFN